MDSVSGNIVGYDPGGNEKHGFAVLHVDNGEAQKLTVQTLDNAEEVISKIEETSNLIGVGIDTMTCWSTGRSGWRPADEQLRENCEQVKNSVMSPNGLVGAMGINGMTTLISIRDAQKDLFVTETHPKVLYYALTEKKYDYENHASRMNYMIQNCLDIKVETDNDHEWDAAISTYAVLQGLKGEWTNDLHKLDCREGERLIEPAGETHYFWPES